MKLTQRNSYLLLTGALWAVAGGLLAVIFTGCTATDRPQWRVLCHERALALGTGARVQRLLKYEDIRYVSGYRITADGERINHCWVEIKDHGDRCPAGQKCWIPVRMANGWAFPRWDTRDIYTVAKIQTQAQFLNRANMMPPRKEPWIWEEPIIPRRTP